VLLVFRYSSKINAVVNDVDAAFLPGPDRRRRMSLLGAIRDGDDRHRHRGMAVRSIQELMGINRLPELFRPSKARSGSRLWVVSTKGTL